MPPNHSIVHFEAGKVVEPVGVGDFAGRWGEAGGWICALWLLLLKKDGFLLTEVGKVEFGLPIILAAANCCDTDPKGPTDIGLCCCISNLILSVSFWSELV